MDLTCIAKKYNVRIRNAAETERSKIYTLMHHLSVNRFEDSVYFGKDEFLTDDAKDALFKPSNKFTISSEGEQENGDPIAYIVITPSHMFMMNIPTYADIRIIPNIDNNKDLYSFRTLLDLGVDITTNLGYEACIFDTFSSNLNKLKTLESSGFRSTAVIRRSGYVYNQGWQDNVVLIKEIKDIKSCLSERSTAMADQENVWWKHVERAMVRQEPNLPILLKDGRGHQYYFRRSQEEDAPFIKEIVKNNMNSGTDCPNNIPFSVEDILAEIHRKNSGTHLFTIEDPMNESTIAGAYLVCPSWHTRSVKPLWCDTQVWWHEEYRSKGLSMDKSVPRFLSMLGYEGSLSDSFITNMDDSYYRNNTGNGVVKVGVIPYTGYLNNHGWCDSTINCFDCKAAKL